MMWFQKLKSLRLDKKLSQQEVANQLNITRACLANYEQGIREPSLTLLKLLCDFYDVSADYIIGRTDDY